MFDVYSRLIGDVEPLEVLPGASGLSLGMAVSLTAGALAQTGATAKPTHIVAGKGVTVDDTLYYPAMRVLPTTILETRAGSTAVATTNVGSAVTLGSDGLTVTNTTTSGVFTVTYTDALANGVVRGYFA